MPRVRAYGTPQVQRRPIAGVKQQADTAAWEGVARIGGQVADIALGVAAKARNDEDRAVLQKADNDLSERQQQLALNAQTITGDAAFGLPEQTEKEFDDFASGIEEKLSNPRQRAAFANSKANALASLRSSVYQHVSRERQLFTRAQSERGVDLAASDAIANASDPVRVSRSLEKGTAIVRDALKGQAPETVAAGVQDFQTKVHVGVLNRLLSTNQDKAAKVYFEETRHQINGDALARIEQAIDTGSKLGDAQRLSDAIVAEGGSLTEQRDKAKLIEDPDVRDRALQYIEHEDAIRKRENQVEEEDLMVTAGNLIDKGGLKAVTADLWVKLTPSQKTSLEQYAKRKATGAGAAAIKTDYPTYYALVRQAAEDPETFATQPLMAYRHKLNDVDFERIISMQAGVLKGGKQSTPELDDSRTELQVVDGALRRAGIDPTPTDKQKQLGEKVAWFRSQVAAEQRRVQEITKKKVSNEELEAITKRILGQQVLDRGWFFDSTTNIMDAEIGDVPRGARAEIIAEYRRNGVMNPTDGQILMQWLDYATRKGK